jgi:hypothetical protein
MSKKIAAKKAASKKNDIGYPAENIFEVIITLKVSGDNQQNYEKAAQAVDDEIKIRLKDLKLNAHGCDVEIFVD